MISNVIIVLFVTLQTNEEQPAETPKVLLYNQQNHISEGISQGEVYSNYI